MNNRKKQIGYVLLYSFIILALFLVISLYFDFGFKSLRYWIGIVLMLMIQSIGNFKIMNKYERRD